MLDGVGHVGIWFPESRYVPLIFRGVTGQGCTTAGGGRAAWGSVLEGDFRPWAERSAACASGELLT